MSFAQVDLSHGRRACRKDYDQDHAGQKRSPPIWEKAEEGQSSDKNFLLQKDPCFAPKEELGPTAGRKETKKKDRHRLMANHGEVSILALTLAFLCFWPKQTREGKT